MDTTAVTNRPDVTTVSSPPRLTPKPAQVPFSQVLAKTMVSGAEGVIRTPPGGPMMAAALRGGSATMPMSLNRSTLASGTPMIAPEGPGGTVAARGVGAVLGATGTAGTAGAAGAARVTDQTGGIEPSLAQSQEMNLYYLQIQEEVNARRTGRCRPSPTWLKAVHDTVKTAIGNIR